jgi:predicted Zn-dependent protease
MPPTKSRREMLQAFLDAHPNDPFARYGLAMECVKSGDDTAAENHFSQLMAEHPQYVPTYFHYGQLLARIGKAPEARRVLSDGVVTAQKAGDSHARDELQAALDDLKNQS